MAGGEPPAHERPLPDLHVLAPESALARADWDARARALLEEGGPRVALHLRAPTLPGRTLYETASGLARLAAETGSWCVVNGRPDIAAAAGAQAVQLGRGAIPVSRARRVTGSRLHIGASVHAPEEAVRAARDGANYLVLGTIYATPSHPGRRGGGPELIRRARAALDGAAFRRVGLVAIGGLDASNAPGALAAGAAGIAVVRAVWTASDPAEAVRRLLTALAEESE